MNLIDAIKSGRPWRHPDWVPGYWHTREANRTEYYSIEYILSEEWEIQDPSVTITLDQLREAVIHAGYNFGIYPAAGLSTEIAIRLGLEME